jgi:hypothetical protein
VCIVRISNSNDPGIERVVYRFQMRKKMITIGAIVLALLVALIIINRFFFSWVGLVFRAVNLCKYKSIRRTYRKCAQYTLG